MPGWYLEEVKQPLVLKELPARSLAPGEALVEVKAASLNRRDFWITQGMYPGMQLPCILGSDMAGVVQEVADSSDNSWVGKKVIANPGLNWGSDDAAQAVDFSILGMPQDGTFATSCIVPVSTLCEVPSHLNFQQAACLPLAGVTAYRACMTQGQLRPGDKMIVSGIGGGVATWALQLALAIGADVAVTSSSPEKIEKAIQLGAKAGFNYREEKWAKQAAQDFGLADVVVDGAAGKGYSNLIQIAAPGGRIVNYGATAGPPEKIDMFKVFWKQLKLVGSTMGSPADFRSLVSLVEKHQIVPIVDEVFPLEKGNDALHKMRDFEQMGKIVLEM